jgi:hypothetical protein
MYCTKCGRELNEGAAFCSVCGSPTGQSYSGPSGPQYDSNPAYGGGPAYSPGPDYGYANNVNYPDNRNADFFANGYDPNMNTIVNQTPEISWIQDSPVEWHTDSVSPKLSVKLERQIVVRQGGGFMGGGVRYFDHPADAAKHIRGLIGNKRY